MTTAATAPVVLLPYPAESIPGLPAELEAHVFDNTSCDGRPGPPPAELLARTDFLVVPYSYLHPGSVLPLLPAMPRLRVVQTQTAGVDDILPHIPAGVTLCNARGVHDASTAELALTLTLAALRDVPRFVRGQDAEQWQAGFYPALADRTVLIVGYGAVGAAIEERLRPFECEVLRVARTARSAPHGPVHSLAELPELLPAADVVILAVPLSDATRGLVDAGFLAALPDGALLVNVARGPVVDTGALLAELTAGRLRAALDVTDPEPLPAGHPLWHAPGVLITPHVGGSSSAFLPRSRRLIAAQLSRFVKGEPLENVIIAG
ncbi:phosphoglycerate dehydrogenase-like enzyme [Kitasatospora sp. MAP12-15]|uniref:2-hydroxyacid dehydrogenase n=1 Tax=unclassified Kitasatospora TaxID=2633591 RepID=UPI002474C819|nr:2-hydroxyacid dehydrogenase [Kitasatospora sp. MAP12-44]MDH6114388.1 phosphoglycerate dehydrogenase-like enzyme [Kitasatospora sp. MAP12-44]